MPPSTLSPHRAATHPDAVHEESHHAPTDLPRQRLHAGPDGVGQRSQAGEAGPLLCGREVSLRFVAGPGASEEPFAPVMLAEHRAQPDVVTPRLELGYGAVTDRSEMRRLIIDGLRGQTVTLQTFIDVGADMGVEQVRADARALRAAARQAPVADEAVRIDGAAHHRPAPRAAHKAGIKAVGVAGTLAERTLDVVGATPEAAVDDGRPRILDAQAAWSDEHPERCFAADDAPQGARRPACPSGRGGDLVGDEAVGDRAPAFAVRARGEDARDDECSRVVDGGQAVGGLAVPVGCLAGEPSRGRGTVLGGAEALVGEVAVPFGHDQQQAEHRAAQGRRGIDLLGDADDAGAHLVQVTDRRQAADDGAREPVDPGDDDAAGLAGADASQRLVHAGAIHRPAATVEILVPGGDMDAVSVRPGADRVTLLVGALEAFAASPTDLRDAHVPVKALHGRGIVQWFAWSPRSGATPHSGTAGAAAHIVSVQQRGRPLVTWSKFDDLYDEHPKVEEAWEREPMTIGLHVQATTHCNRLLTDGVIQPRWLRYKIPDKRKRERVLRVMVQIGLLDALDENEIRTLTDRHGDKIVVGPFPEKRYLLHDFLERHESRARVLARRNADAARKAAGRTPKIHKDSGRSPAGQTTDVQSESNGSPLVPACARSRLPTRPDPTKDNNNSTVEPERLDDARERVKTAAVEEVFAVWVAVTGRTGQTLLDDKRRRVIRKALQSYPLPDVVDAVRGWRHSPHHRGENDRATTFNDLQLLLRDAEHIEKFRDLERAAGNGGTLSPGEALNLRPLA